MKLRVLMCCSDIHTYQGGMVSVVKNYLAWEKWEDVQICFVPTHIEGSRLKKSLYFLRAYFRIWGMLRKKEVDIAHLHVAERGSFYRKSFLLRLCRHYRVPVILHHHAAEFESFYENLSARQKKYVKDTFAAASVNLVLGEYWKKGLPGSLSPENTQVLYNAVSVPEIMPRRNKADGLLFMGRLGKRKGVYELLEALKQIDGALPEHIRCCLCGDGEKEQVLERIRELGLEKRVSCAGWIDGAQKEAILADTAVNILPSWNEGLPMTLLESMARGIPSITTRIAAIPEAVSDGWNGILIQPGDAEGLARAILNLTSDPELLSAMGKNSYETVREHFSMERHMEKLTAVYRTVLGRSGSTEKPAARHILTEQRKD